MPIIHLRHEYRSCKQRKNESVQDYAFRFKSLCTQLDISDSNIDAIDIFVRGLHSNIFREYKRTESQETRAGQGNKYNSLDYVIEVCIDVDVTERTVGLSMDRSQDKPSGDSSKSKYCSFHKTNSHNTSECRTKKSAENNSNNTSSVKSENQNTSPNSNSNYPHITCFTCKQQGHYQNNCPTKKQNNNINVQVKSEVKPQIKSTDSTSDRRHSDRTPNPVNRLTYVGKGVQSANAISIDNNYSPTSDESTVASVTLKPPMVSAEHPAVWFSLGKYVYKTLLDTGANVSIIDKKLIPECNLNVIPVAGKIKLAQEGNTADRIGIIDPLSITAIFPVPGFNSVHSSVRDNVIRF